MVNSQEILKEVENLCNKLVQNHENWHKEREKVGSKVKREGEKSEKRKEHEIEEKVITGKFLRKRSEILKEIKDQILKDLTLWELDLEGNVCPTPGVSVNTTGAGGGYILFGYNPGQSYIHFFNEFNENYHQEITRAFVEEIKQNPQDWKIIVEDQRDVPFISKPMVANASDHQVVKHKSGRRQSRGYQWYKEKPGFSDEEWTEIENVLNGQKPNNNKELEEEKNELQIEENKNKKIKEEKNELIAERKKSLQNSDNKSNNRKNVYYGLGVASLVLLITTTMIVVSVKKKKR